MESAEPSSKMRRVQKSAKLHVTECIRPFKLTQQFPSTILGHRPIAREYPLCALKCSRSEKQPRILTYSNKNKVNGQNRGKPVEPIYQCSEKEIIHQISSTKVLNNTRMVQKTSSSVSSNGGLSTVQKGSSTLCFTGDVKNVQKVNSVSSTSLITNVDSHNKLKTLKLKGPDGKELGEFQVTVLDQPPNPLKRKLVTISKHLSSLDESQGSAVVSSTQAEPVVSYSIKDIHYPGAIYQEPRIERVGNENGKVKVISDVSLCKQSTKQATKSYQKKETVKKTQENSILYSKSNSKKRNPWIKMDMNRVVISNIESGSLLNNSSKINKSNATSTNKVLYLRPEDHPYLKNITQSGKPISLKPVKLKSLGLSKNKFLARENTSEVSSFMGSGGLQGYKNGDMDEELENDISTVSYSIDLERIEQNSSKPLSGIKVKLPNSSVNELPKQTNSGINSIKGNMQYSDEEEFGSSETIDTDDSVEQALIEYKKNTEKDGLKTLKNYGRKQTNSESSRKMIENGSSENVSFESTPDISILERALASVKDKGLREEALKVLATCKLGIDRQVPIRPPTDTFSVRDTSTQTNVFGNLDRDCEEFIEVKEETKGVKRIEKRVKNRYVDCKSLNILNPVDEAHIGNQYTSQLDDLLSSMDLNFESRQEVKQIKEVLNKPIKSNERINQIQTQVQKDLQLLTDYDENGLLGLHKAVMEDKIFVVKRLLLIIKASRRDVDMKTLDGKTSLELALKTDADPDIVKALLEAGAKPSSKETGYDSALIIASKNSSPLLPELLKYCNKDALCSMDSDGFAAVHHCALRGNLTAISALYEAGANIDLQDCRSGRTALFHAIENLHSDTARQLIACGAKPNIRNSDGQTILPLLDDVKFQSLKPAVYKAMKW